MYKQTLCVTLPISAAVIIAAALFANAGDLDPPKGPIEPTMHDLQEIYDLVQQSSPCGGCTWEYAFVDLGDDQTVLAVPGSGVLHGLWLKGNSFDYKSKVQVFNGPPGGNDQIGEFHNIGSPDDFRSEFFELDVAFDNALYLDTSPGWTVKVTVLYRSTN